jgi:hypothetical protein
MERDTRVGHTRDTKQEASDNRQASETIMARETRKVDEESEARVDRETRGRESGNRLHTERS